MPDPIHIDLRDLTPEKLAECEPHMGTFRYSDPCVLGTLIPEAERARMDAGRGAIEGLLINGVVTMPEDQRIDADQLQYSFDDHDWPTVERIAAKWMGKAVSK